MEARFNLRQTIDENRVTPIYLVCTINRKQEKFSTGQKIRPKYWDKDKQVAIVSNVLPKAIQSQNKKVNEALAIIKNKFEEWDYYMLEHPEEQDRATEKLRAFLKDERARLEVSPIEWFEAFVKEDKTTSDGTKRKYLTDLTTIKQFIEEKKIRANEFTDINFSFLTRYEAYLTEKGRKITTIINKKRSLLAWIHEAERQGLINTIVTGVSRYKLPKNKESSNDIYLTDEELDKMLNLRLTGNEEAIRDIFILQCQLGQRYGDMMNLSKAVITDEEITLIQEKTSEKVIIPLNKIAKDILNKYNNVLPSVGSEYANQLLKEIGKKAGIDNEILVTEQKGSKLEAKKIPKYEQITTHTARRTFITNAVKKGIPAHIVMRVTGHKSLKTFEAYNKMTADDVADILLKEVDNEEERIRRRVRKEIESYKEKLKKADEENYNNLFHTLHESDYSDEEILRIFKSAYKNIEIECSYRYWTKEDLENQKTMGEYIEESRKFK